MEYAADDAAAIKARMLEIRKENTPAIERLDSLSSEELDALGSHYGVDRDKGESDYYYRSRIKIRIG